jgi:hypothetical protein
MSQLNSYISKLLSDDDALKDFLKDPIKAAEDGHGLTKGQRSVLRRVVANLSNNSTNGYSIVRDLTSYRRSIRLLQNVLHLERGHASNAQDSPITASVSEADTSTTYTIFVYYNGDPTNPLGSVNNPSAQYAYSVQYKSTVPANSTLETIMNNAVDSKGNLLQYDSQYYPATQEEAVVSFTIPSGYTGAGTYLAPPHDDASSRAPFWFFSVGGQAITSQGGSYGINPNASYGYAGNLNAGTFVDYKPQDNVIYWQCIAPDRIYGFQACG